MAPGAREGRGTKAIRHRMRTLYDLDRPNARSGIGLLRAAIMNMDPTTSQRIVGNISAGLAILIFLIPLQRLLMEWARREASNDQWVTPALTLLAPQWLLLMVALLCVTAGGGFDWLRMGRPMLYTLTVAGALALATLSFVFIALYIRPGFTPRGLYSPVLYLITLSTVLLVVLCLNPKLLPAIPAQRLLRPWVWFTALSLVGSVAMAGYWMVNTGAGGAMSIAHRILNPGPTTAEQLTGIARLDPEKDFVSLLWRANGDASTEVREAASTRLRSHPRFLERLSSELESGYAEPALSFLRDADLSPAERTRFARPARTALQRWVDRIPASNYTTKSNRKDLERWGRELFRVLPEKFACTGVDFSEVIADFEFRLEQ